MWSSLVIIERQKCNYINKRDAPHRIWLGDSPNKARVVREILFIVIMWHKINELEPETPFFYSTKINK